MGDKVLPVSLHHLFGLGILLFVPYIQCVTKEYHFVNMKLNWTDAQQFCREHFTDLATVESADDLNNIKIPPGDVAWIGLHDDPAAWYQVMTSEANSWRWSSTGTTSPGGYQNWIPDQPDNWQGTESCVMIENYLWNDYFCSGTVSCLCYTAQSDVKQFFLINDTQRNWTDCQSVCRQRYHDLAMIESEAEDQAAVKALAGEIYVWIGLYRHPWTWSDLSNSNYRNWSFEEPNNVNEKQHCVRIYDNHEWDDETCTNLLPFICHKVVKEKSVSMTKIKFQSDVNMSDPYVREQLLKLLEERLKEENPNADFKLRWTKPPTKEKLKKKNQSCPKNIK